MQLLPDTYELKGRGTATVRGKSIGDVLYQLQVTPSTDRGLGEAHGKISAANPMELRDAFESGSSVIISREEGGDTIPCFIMKIDDGEYHVDVDGSLDGLK